MKRIYQTLIVIISVISTLVLFQNCSKNSTPGPIQIDCEGLIPETKIEISFNHSHGKLKVIQDGSTIFDECDNQLEYSIAEDNRPASIVLSMPRVTLAVLPNSSFTVLDKGNINCTDPVIPIETTILNAKTVVPQDEAASSGSCGAQVTNRVYTLQEAVITNN